MRRKGSEMTGRGSDQSASLQRSDAQIRQSNVPGHDMGESELQTSRSERQGGAQAQWAQDADRRLHDHSHSRSGHERQRLDWHDRKSKGARHAHKRLRQKTLERAQGRALRASQ